jgi:hypothetical protein
MSAKTIISNIMNELDEFKEKLSDGEYKKTTDLLLQLYNSSQIVKEEKEEEKDGDRYDVDVDEWGSDEDDEEIKNLVISASEEELLALIDECGGHIIRYMNGPDGIVRNISERVQEMVIKTDPWTIDCLENPSEKLQLEALINAPHFANKYVSENVKISYVKMNGLNIQNIQNFKESSEKLRLAAVTQNAEAIRFIKDPSEELQLAAVTQNAEAIRFIKDPSEEVQLTAVRGDYCALDHIKSPTEAVKLEVVTQDGMEIQYIRDPSEGIQLAAVKNNRMAIMYILAPSEKVKNIVRNSRR